MTATTNKGLEAQTTGSNSGTWGDVLNNQVIAYLDTMLGGVVAISLASSTVLISQANARNCMLSMTGVLLSNVAVNRDSGVLMVGFYYWENLTTGNFSVTFGYGAGTTTSVVLPQGRRGVMWMDTTGGVRIVSIAGSSTADPIPAGSITTFYNNAAPSGWTAISLSGIAFAAKIVDSGGGGVSSGSVDYTTLFGRTATDSFTLTANEIPNHNHAMFGAGAAGTENAISARNQGVAQALTASGAGDLRYTMNQGNSPSLGITESIGSGNGHTHPLDMRVRTLAFVLASRN